MLLREHLAASPFSPWTHTNAEYLPSLLVCSHFGRLTRFAPLRIVTSVTSEGLVRSTHLDVYFRMLAWKNRTARAYSNAPATGTGSATNRRDQWENRFGAIDRRES